jgi:hypothetical protein
MDILDVLERHAVRKSGSDRDVGRAVGLVGSLALAYSGADNDARALGESMGTWGPLTRPSGPGGTLVAMRWKCPNPECPPTDVAPVDVTSQYNEVPTSQCGGECGAAYPTSAFERVT